MGLRVLVAMLVSRTMYAADLLCARAVSHMNRRMGANVMAKERFMVEKAKIKF